MVDAARQITSDLADSERKGCVQAAIMARDVQRYADSAEEYLSYVGQTCSTLCLIFPRKGAEDDR